MGHDDPALASACPPDECAPDAGTPARLDVQKTDTGAVLRFSGRLTVAAVALLWDRALQEASAAQGQAMVIDLAGMEGCDTAGATLLLATERAHGGSVSITGANPAATAVLDLVRPAAVPPARPRPGPAQSWREVFRTGLQAAGGGVAYLGEIVVAIARLPSRLRMFRMADLLRQADQAGVQAIPLVLLLGVLIGLILAFQSLVPMRRFGADIYVANLVALGLFRELGPLLTAVVLSGRSGSAFAAEIGTMKVNQELDALTTMGVDAMTMLVLPRLLAAILVMPALTIAMELAGLLGMTIVLASAGIPVVTVAHQVAAAVLPRDFYGGLLKAALFGAAVAAIGCRAGLSTGVGPRAVGLSATSAVVGGIVVSIVIDGVLAVLTYRLGI